jgi:hypothetical protein
MIQNPTLYEQVKEEADKRYDKPSAYKSGWIVKTYKERGGTYAGTKPKTGLSRWYKERWMDVGGKDYPVYRPTIRVSKDTPLTVQEIDPKNLTKQIALKQRIRGLKNLPRFNKKISPHSIMPRKMKGEGFLDDLKSFGLSAAKDVGRELIPIAKDYAIDAAKSYLTKKPASASTGKGLYATRGSGYSLSPAQARALAVGKGVQLKPSMMGGEYEMKMTPAMEKKLMKAFAKGKGMRVSSQNLMEVKKGGFIMPMLTTAARIAAPIIIEKLADAGIKKLGGKKGGSKMGQEMSKLLHGDRGSGLYAGGGMSDPDGVMSEVIQSGSPYQSTNSPAMNPYVPTRNPYGMYNPI